MEALVVVGNGMVSHRLCAGLIERGAQRRYRITVIGDEPRPAYDRVHLTGIFNGRKPESLMLAPASWYADHGITLRLGECVTSIDAAKRCVRLGADAEIPYDHLVLATGASPYIPPIPGSQLPGVFPYRTMADLEVLKSSAVKVPSAAVIGGGLLGLEGARALLDLGLKVDVIQNADWLLQRQLDRSGGRLVQTFIEKLGVRVHLSRQISRIEAQTNGLSVRFTDGTDVSAGVVLLAVGVRPRVELAAAAGIKHSPAGIVINDALETSDARISALGDCALHRSMNYGLVAPGYQMADVLAERLCGGSRVFAGADLSARLKLLGADVSVLGAYDAEGPGVTTHAYEAGGVYRKIVLREGKLAGFACVGACAELGRIQDSIYPPQSISTREIQRFTETGVLWPADDVLPVGLWPETATVCNCMRISRGALTACMREGCTTVEALASKTGASTMCGSCKPLLAQLVGAPAPVERGRKRLLVASIAALAFAGLIAALPAIPNADSIQLGWTIDRLWRDEFLKQVTGFSLVGLCAGAMVYSARKRMKKFRAGDIGVWKFVHAFLGAMGLVVLVAHTGFRLGANLNLVLMLNFLLLAVLGAATGGITALSRRMQPATAQRLQRGWALAHVLVVWPLPVLILFHAIAFYFF